MFETLPAGQLSLFDQPKPNRKVPPCQDDLISPAEEADLVARIAELPLAPFQFHGFEGKRRIVNFGWSYDFAAGRAFPTEPLPDWLAPVRDRVALWAGVDPSAIGQAGVIEYAPGAPIGWHRDRPIYEEVIGVSLQASRTLRLRRRSGSGWERAALPLAPRSVYVLRGTWRDEWEHSIPPGEDLRYAVMFRTLRPSHPGV